MLGDWLVGKDKLDLQRATYLELASQWKRILGSAENARETFLEEEPAIPQVEEMVGEDGSSEEDAIPSAEKLKTVAWEASYVIVAGPGGIFRLHQAGSDGCWMGRKRDRLT